MNTEQNAETPHPNKKKRHGYLRGFGGIVALFSVILFLYLDAPLEGEYRGDFTDSISGRGVLVLRDGQMLIRTIDGIEAPFAPYMRKDSGWVVIAGQSEWQIDRGMWGFKLIIPNDRGERFRRLFPFENPYVEFPP